MHVTRHSVTPSPLPQPDRKTSNGSSPPLSHRRRQGLRRCEGGGIWRHEDEWVAQGQRLPYSVAGGPRTWRIASTVLASTQSVIGGAQTR